MSPVEGRIVASAGVALVGTALLVTIRPAAQLVEEFLKQGTKTDTPLVGEIPAALAPTGAVARILQAAVVFEATLLLLTIWGFQSLVRDVVTQLVNTGPLVVRVAGTAFLLSVFLLVTRNTEDHVDEFSEGVNRLGEHEKRVLLRVIHLGVFVAVGLATLSLWQFRLGNLLLGAGVLSVVVGIGSRHLLSSSLAGFSLMFSRPFEVGDWIGVEDVEGTVTDITIMHTHLRSFDGETVVLPNDEVHSSTVTNRSSQGRLRLQLDIGVDYDTDFERAKTVAEEAIREVDDVLEAPAPNVVGFEFADSAIVLRLWFWIDNPSINRKWQTRTAVLESVKADFDDADIEIPYPKREFQKDEVPPER